MTILTVLAAAFSFLAGSEKNEPPVVSQVACKLSANKVRITYNLYDAENDSINVLVKVYGRNNAVLPLTVRAEGDVGYPVMPGRKKRITLAVPPGAERISLVVEDTYAVHLDSLISQVDTSSIRRFLQELSIERNYRTSPDNVNRIKSLVAGYFTGQGLDTLRQAVRHDGYTGHNIIGIKPGTERPELVLIGAHFDAVENTPGADDNASGVAGMLEAGRILSRFTLKTGVGFAAFDLEEEGLLGSRQILKDTSFARKTLAYLNFDMIGYRSVSPGSQRFPHGFEELFPEVFQQLVDNHSKGDFLLICANEQSDSLSALFSRNAARAAPSLRTVSLLIPGSEYYGPDFARDYFDPAIFRRSDHASFWDSGLNALSLGDTAELRNANYHSGTDGCDTVDIEFISLVVKATLATVVELCGLAHGSSYSVTLTPK